MFSRSFVDLGRVAPFEPLLRANSQGSHMETVCSLSSFCELPRIFFFSFCTCELSVGEFLANLGPGYHADVLMKMAV